MEPNAEKAAMAGAKGRSSGERSDALAQPAHGRQFEAAYMSSANRSRCTGRDEQVSGAPVHDVPIAVDGSGVSLPGGNGVAEPELATT